MLYPPQQGICGNSHVIMQDKNNLQIADLILEGSMPTSGVSRLPA